MPKILNGSCPPNDVDLQQPIEMLQIKNGDCKNNNITKENNTYKQVESGSENQEAHITHKKAQQIKRSRKFLTVFRR